MEDWESQAKSNSSDDDFYHKTAKGQGRPKKRQVASSSEEEIVVKKSSRIRKQVLKNDQISRVLSDSEDDVEEEEEEEEEDSVSNSESDNQPKNKGKFVENSNCRRSGRERTAAKMFTAEMTQTRKRKIAVKPNSRSATDESDAATDESDDDDDFQRRKPRNRKKKSKPKSEIRERAKRKRTKVKGDDEKLEASGSSDGNSGTSDNVSEVDDTIKRYRAKIKGREAKNNGRKEHEESQRETRMGRPKERVQYGDDETSHDSDIDSNDDRDEVVEEENEEQVGSVHDFRKGKKGATGDSTKHFNVLDHGDPNLTLETEETEDQYLIKWEGFAHHNNTWESLETLQNRPNNKPLKSLKKVHNYIDKVGEYNRWKKTASPEDVEYQEIELQMERNLLQTYLEPERIFAEETNSDTNRIDYYVKWKNLPYNESTWENSEVVKSYYPSLVENYLARKESNSNPANFKQIAKSIKKRWQPMKEQPDYIGSETLKLRDYQLNGINFLLHAFHKGNSVILADEMGLGKTIQTIVFLKYLFYNYTFKGPMLVSVPLSTLAAWQKEFETWAPDMNVVVYIGDGKSREIIRQYECEDQETGDLIFNVLLTSYEMVGRDRDFFVSISWSNIVIDEAHRLKNQNSLLYKVLLDIESHHRLLLTGTPLQNSLKELWCLLNYIQVPDLDPWDEFEDNYGSKKDRELGYAKLHTLLKPFIIRRLKKDVEKTLPGKVERILRVDMTVAQKRMYKNVLTRNFDVLSKGKNQVSLLNLMMQLRKTCNHSHLILEPEEIAQDDEERCKQLVYGSGKLVLLDKLLARFREKGDRVLIFSQMVMMLNIIEEFLLLKRYQFQRLDGSVSADDRKQSIARFNNKESTDFCFLLSTKAGGLGINLQTANVVIIFDSDFNPQNDLQAIARAHRIGQKDEVKIYRLVASNSVDEDIIQKAKNKMVLDHLVIQRMDTTGQSIIGGGSFKSQNTDGNKLSKDDLNVILKFGAAELFKDEEETEKEGEIDLDAILEQAEVREEVDDDAHQSEANKELLGAFKCTTLSFEETEKEIEAESETTGLDWDAIIPLELRPEKQNETTEIEVLERKLRRKDLTKESLKDTQLNGSRLASHGDDEEEYLVNSDDESSEDVSDSESEEDLEKPIKKQASKNPMKKPAEETKYLCNKCGKVYTDKRGLIYHMSAKHQEPKYVLTDENYIKLPKNGTNEQANPVLPVKGVSCLICFKTFSNNERLKGHINRQHLAIYNKNDEGVESQDQGDLIEVQDPLTEPSDVPGENAAVKMSSNTEIKLMDGDNTNNNVKNDSATASQIKPTTEQMVLIEKMLNSMKKYECSHCDQRFSVKVELAKHEKQHTSSTWKYTCAHCELRFPSNARLIQHEKRHDGGNKMACPYCTKTYTIRHYFLAHCTNAHADKPLPASLAEKSVKDPEKEKSSISKFEKENGSNHSVVASATMKEEQPVKVNGVKCPYCEKSYTRRDRMVAHCKSAHADKQSAQPDHPLPPSEPVACLHCNKSYSRRDAMLLHCKSAHADKPEPPKRKSPEKPEKESTSNTALTKEEEHKDADVLQELNPLQVTPSTTGDNDDIICLDDDAEVYDDGTSKRQSVSGKSKEKAFQCPECKKGYSDQKNLDFHVKLTHEAKSNTPFADVGPNTNIVVTSNNDKGYEVYKVIKIYSTGSRFKCLKYSHLSNDRWSLTQEVNKNVVKANIKKIVTLKKEQDGENVYTMDMDVLEKKTGVDNGEKEVSDDDKENDDVANVNNSKELTTS